MHFSTVLLFSLPLRALAAPRFEKHDPQMIHARKVRGSSFGLPFNQTVDYLVIGGGTAGLVMATRLAEQTGDLVAVVEAGSFYEETNGNVSQVPASDGFYVGKDLDDWHPGIDWGFATTPQQGSYGARSHYARGKCLGGSSARNYMAYQRPTVGALANWAEKVGDNSYSWERFLPYFEKSVHFTPPDQHKRFANSSPEYDTSVMGDGSGPLSVTFANYCQAFASWAAMAYKEMGIKTIRGFQSGKLLGASYGMYTVQPDSGLRDSSETSFLRRGLNKPNLLVFTRSLGKKIIFENGTRASGALVESDGKAFTIKARKEVILSAGAFQSPQLLMVSGIGPAKTLEQYGIPVIADKPGVGQNMQDHIIHAPGHRVNVLTQSAFNDPAFVDQASKEFNDRSAGMYANPTTDMFAWEKVPEHLRKGFSNHTIGALAEYPADWPEIEYLSVGGYFGFQRNFVTEPPNDGYQYASLAWSLSTPASRGNITITSADMGDAPLINPNWLTARPDIDVSIAAFKRTREFFNTSAIQPILIGPEYFPGEQVATDAQIEDLIRRSFNTIFHASCTCAMGKPDDPMAVIDSRARVIGVQGLRVVDASAFPFLPPGHPQSTICEYCPISVSVCGGA